MRTFGTGATRDSDEEKLDYRGFISPYARERFAQYMHAHRRQPDGTLRDGSNWKRGMPVQSYVESLVRHVADFEWAYESGYLYMCEDLACAIMFNIQGFLHERTKP